MIWIGCSEGRNDGIDMVILSVDVKGRGTLDDGMIGSR